MKRLSLQWRITLMSALLIGITCVAMNLLLCYIFLVVPISEQISGSISRTLTFAPFSASLA